LGLSLPQRDRVRELLRDVQRRFRVEVRGAMEECRAGGAPRRQELLGRLSQEALRILASYLAPGQVQRLRQIELQSRGPAAFADPAVQAALGLSPEQSQRVATVLTGLTQVMQDEAATTGSPELDAPSARALDQILATLNAVQRHAWQEMTGAPTEIL
jgi:hypothetical protein